MSSATGTQVERRSLLSRSDLDALIQREEKPGGPVLSVYLDRSEH